MESFNVNFEWSQPEVPAIVKQEGEPKANAL